MATVTAIAKKDDSADPHAALKRAAVDAQRARAAVDHHRDAIERALHLVTAARRKAEAASKAVAAARDEDAQALAAAIITGSTASPQATVRSRELEIEASDTVLMARAAYKRLESDLKDVEQEVVRADKTVRAAIAAVLKPTAQKMIEEARTFRSQFLARQYALDALCMSLDGFEHLRFDISEAEHRQLCGSIRQSWMDTIDALKRGDIDARLPDLAGG
jgi:hypothetical protein